MNRQFEIFLIAVGLFALMNPISAQEKHSPSLVVGGTLFLAYYQGERSFGNSKTFVNELGPYFAKQVSDRWLIGGQFYFGIRRGNFDNRITKARDLSFGPLARFYFNPENQIRFFLNFHPGVRFDRREESSGEVTKERILYFQSRPGLLYSLSDRLNLFASLGLLNVSSETNSQDDDKDFEGEFSAEAQTLRLGIEFKF